MGFYDLYNSPAEKETQLLLAPMGNANEFMKNFGVTVETVARKPATNLLLWRPDARPGTETEEAKELLKVSYGIIQNTCGIRQFGWFKENIYCCQYSNNIKGLCLLTTGIQGYFGYYTTDINRMGSGVDGHELYHLIDSAIYGEPGQEQILIKHFKNLLIIFRFL